VSKHFYELLDISNGQKCKIKRSYREAVSAGPAIKSIEDKIIVAKGRVMNNKRHSSVFLMKLLDQISQR
jgi:hypothetical protein